MTPFLMLFGWNQLLITAPLAITAWGVDRSRRCPSLAHGLWLLVLLKLLVPPLLSLPLVPSPFSVASSSEPATWASNPVERQGRGGSETDPLVALDAALADAVFAASQPAASFDFEMSDQIVVALLTLWGLGSAFVLVVQLRRLRPFLSLLRNCRREGDERLRRLTGKAAGVFGLRRIPRVETIPARIAPFVWWAGGRARIILPEDVIHSLSDDELECVISHETAHIVRRDPLIRWAECIAAMIFWWHPLTWLARIRLRSNEELCCDALVLQKLGTEPRRYAGSLIRVLECLAPSEISPPSVVCSLNSGGAHELEHRLEMIMDKHVNGRRAGRLSTLILTATLVILPLGVTYAQDARAIGGRLKAAVTQGEITAEQAIDMMAALNDSADTRKWDLSADDDLWKAYAQALLKADIAEENVKPVLSIVRKIAGWAQMKGGNEPTNSEFSELLRSKYGLNEKQIGVVVMLANKLAVTQAASQGLNDEYSRVTFAEKPSADNSYEIAFLQPHLLSEEDASGLVYLPYSLNISDAQGERVGELVWDYYYPAEQKAAGQRAEDARKAYAVVRKLALLISQKEAAAYLSEKMELPPEEIARYVQLAQQLSEEKSAEPEYVYDVVLEPAPADRSVANEWVELKDVIADGPRYRYERVEAGDEADAGRGPEESEEAEDGEAVDSFSDTAPEDQSAKLTLEVKLIDVLSASGIPDASVRPTARLVIRLARKLGNEEIELNARGLSKVATQLKLNASQTETVIKLAQRLAAAEEDQQD